MKAVSSRALLVVFHHFKYIMPFPSGLQNFAAKSAYNLMGWLWGLDCHKTCFGLLVHEARAQGVLRLSSLLVGGLNLGTNAGPLVGGAGSWNLWLNGPGGPWSGVSLLEDRVRVQVVQGLVLAHWWVELWPRVSGCRAWGSWIWWCPTGGWGLGPRRPWASAGALVGVQVLGPVVNGSRFWVAENSGGLRQLAC